MAASRILLIRTSALGDIVHSLPVLRALRRGLPDARIAWVVEEGFAPLLEGHPDLDQLLTVRLRAWRREVFRPATWRQLGGFLGALDRFGAEVALDLMGNHKSAAIAALSMCDQRIGLGRAWRREPSSAFWLSRTVAPRGRHAVDHALSILDALGLSPEPADFGGERLFREVSPTLQPESEPTLLLHPGAGWANKTYPPERWGEAVHAIGEASGLHTRVSAGPGERELADRVIAASEGWAAPLDDRSLGDLATAIRSSRLVMGGDTGPVHLAHALAVPVLCLMGPTDPERNGPYEAPGSALFERLPCSFCHRRFDSVKPCLLEIQPAEVADRALSLLASSGQRPDG